MDRQVSDQLLASTNDMLLNAGAIGRCLQEMGAGFADVSATVPEKVLMRMGTSASLL